MFKIGDFSKFSRVSIKALRYYDEIGLKGLGLSLEETSQLLADNLPLDKIIELLRTKRKETLERMREEEARLKRVEEWLIKVEKEGIMPVYDVVIKNVDALTVASVRDVIPTYGDISRLYNELFTYLGRHRVQFAGPPMAIYHDMEYREKDADVEAAVPVAGNVPAGKRVMVRELAEVEQMACVIHKGLYENFNQAYKALMTWIEQHGYQIIGPNREIYIKGPGKFIKGDPANYITEIQMPVKQP